MVKETYIYKELNKIYNQSDNKVGKLNLISDWILKEYDIKTCFCEIIGKRWSFIAGTNEFLVSEYSTKITDTLGIIAENIKIKQETWEKIINNIKNLSWGQTP